MTFSPRQLALTTLVLSIVSVPALADEAAPLSVEVRNLSDKALTNVPVTFGQVYRRGEVPKHKIVVGPRVQFNVKRRHDDGSARFAIVSAILGALPAGGSRTLRLTVNDPVPVAPKPPLSTREVLQTDFDAVVTLTFPDGAVRTASARKMLKAAGGGSSSWLKGQLAAEWLVSGPPVDKDGKPDEDLNVQFQVRTYEGGKATERVKAARVSVVVENCWDTWAGNIRYDAKITVGGKEVFSAKAVDHRRLSRWRKVVWWGREAPPVQVVPDVRRLSAAGALPNYDTTVKIPKRRRPVKMTGPLWEVLGSGSLCRYMPTTGGRSEIGPYPAWTVRYLLAPDAVGERLVLANGDLAGSWPIHVRARKTGRIMTIDDRPKFWLDSRGLDRPTWQADRHAADESLRALVPDGAHQPSLAYVPYLLTGDFYYLEEAYFWANYCLLRSTPSGRQDAKGVITGQVRGLAWKLRNVADAATIAPDGHPEGKYFSLKARNSLAAWRGRTCGPPQANTMGFHGLRSMSNARIKNPANPNWLVMVPWEHDYLIWSLHHATELGYPEARGVRDFLLRWRVGTLTNEPDFDPRRAAQYRMVVGERDPKTGKVTLYEDWKRLQAENVRLAAKARLPNYAGSYAYSARGAVVCGVDAGFPKAREALARLEKELPGWHEKLAGHPTWAIMPSRATKPPPGDGSTP